MTLSANLIVSLGFRPNVVADSVSKIGFGSQTQQDGKSGYWRLFFYKMQEEALKKKNAPEIKETRTPEGVEAVITAKPKKKKKVQKAEPTWVPEELPKFKLAPIAIQPTIQELIYNSNQLPTHHSLVALQQVLVVDLNEQRIKRRKLARRKAAAFLLMAA